MSGRRRRPTARWCGTVALVLLVALAGCNGATAPDGGTVTPADVPADRPPGVGESAVTDADLLADAHRSTLNRRGYVLVKTRTVLDPGSGRTLDTLRLRLAVAPSGTAYNLTRRESSVRAYIPSGPFSQIDIYYAGDSVSRRFVDEDGVVRAWTNTGVREGGPVRELTERGFVAGTMAAFRPSVTSRERAGRATGYRLRGEELVAPGQLRTPPLTDRPRNATLRATVTGKGVVRSLTLAYDATYRNRTVRVRQTLAVHPAEAPVTRPEWAGE